MVFSHREMKKEKDVFDPLRKRRSKRQTTEREEYEIDVRYQNRTEITLGCEEKNTVKGYFILKFRFLTEKRNCTIASFSNQANVFPNNSWMLLVGGRQLRSRHT